MNYFYRTNEKNNIAMQNYKNMKSVKSDQPSRPQSNLAARTIPERTRFPPLTN